MAKNYIQRGETVGVAAPAAVLSGALVKVGVLVGVAQTTALAGEHVEIAIGGVWKVKKTAGQAWTVGAALYLVPDTGALSTATTAGNIFVGAALEAAASAATEGVVRLNPSVSAAVTA